jgi:hypothetical protein
MLVALAMIVVGAAGYQGFPEVTQSGVCPAIEFSHELHGDTVKFVPSVAPTDLEFVDVHTAVVTPEHRQIGDLVNKRMVWTGSAYEMELDDETAGVLRANPQFLLKYSFTYCVMMGGGENVDCNTEIFAGLTTVFSWEASYPACPSQCGHGASKVLPQLSCWGSDNIEYYDEHCAHLPAPSAKICPATEACTVFSWEASYPACPTQCGQEAFQIQPQLSCWGDDNIEYYEEHCAHLTAPSAKMCPATEACTMVVKKMETVVEQIPTMETVKRIIPTKKSKVVQVPGVRYVKAYNPGFDVVSRSSRMVRTAPAMVYRQVMRAATPVVAVAVHHKHHKHGPPGF